jgi:hypothetical protein
MLKLDKPGKQRRDFKRRGEIKPAFMKGYYLKHDVAQWAMDPLGIVLKAICGPKYEDTEEYIQDKLR